MLLIFLNTQVGAQLRQLELRIHGTIFLKVDAVWAARERQEKHVAFVKAKPCGQKQDYFRHE